jgi:aspartate/methionine/tyrosine aminotransferase
MVIEGISGAAGCQRSAASESVWNSGTCARTALDAQAARGYPERMGPRFASRVAGIRPFLAMEVMERAFAMERAGARVIHLEVGEPDFDPPPAAVRACVQALEAGETHYTDSRGLAELREAIAADYRRRFDVQVDPSQVIVSSGTSPAMLLVFSLLVEAGDQVIVGTPHYPCYPNFIRVCGAEPVFVRTRPEEGYRLDPDAVRAALTPRTRAIVVSSPANPTGAVQDAQTLAGLAELGPPLVSDEIYDGLVYDGARVTSALQVTDRAFVLDGFSKRYAMTGFRLGYVIAPEHALRPLQVLQQNLFISANRFVQHAGLAALREGAATLEAMRQAYDRRRRLLVEGLRQLGFDVPVLPQGAFYVFADARAFGSDSLALAFDLLERAQVGTCPGIDFGEAGEGWLRFCCAASEASIAEALERLGRVLPELR